MIRLLVLLAVMCAAPVWGATVPESLPGAPAFEPEVRTRLERALAAQAKDYQPRTRHKTGNTPEYTNRLILESSPYLRQHAHNPVNWYPWGDEAFARAKELGRPVLVSIGYSTCHWCHVMEEESFDDVETARQLNAGFIAIKVDRELRPDVDSIYMAAVQALTGHGGWPLNIWLTPDRRPFFGGTYFPPADRQGRRSFRTTLRLLSDAWTTDRGRVDETATALTDAVRAGLEGTEPQTSFEPHARLLGAVLAAYQRDFDPQWGGVRGRQKFPSSLPVRLLLRLHRRSGDARALSMAVRSLEAMARGGLQDHVGGGFHRYTTDSRWRVPHFEKMLYDNALLVPAYVEGWQVTGRAEFARVARRTLDYVVREMTSPEGGFYSATDADSLKPDGHMHEGWFFTWTPEEIDAALDAKTASAVKRYFGVTASGNFEGRTVLHVPGDVNEGDKSLLSSGVGRLYAARALRPKPLLDDKILAGWNGLMISAFAQAGLAFDSPEYVTSAARAAQLVLGPMRTGGRLHRSFRAGAVSGAAFLSDYAFVIAGLLDLYEATADPRWLREAMALQTTLDAHYAAPGGGYFATADDHEALLAREKPDRDGAVPSGNSISLLNLLRLYEWTTDEAYLSSATSLLSAFQRALVDQPRRLPVMLMGVDFLLDAPKQVIVVAPEQGTDATALLAELRRVYLPNRVVVSTRQGAELRTQAELVPLVREKRARKGLPTAYVCEDRVCEEPTSDPARFAEQLRSVRTLSLSSSP